jgi:hypothetical protein
MVRPWVADGGDGLQMWRVAANILNKQPRIADKGWSFCLEVERRANNFSHKNNLLRNVTQGFEAERIRWNELGSRK